MAALNRIEALAREWLRLDRNVETRSEIEMLLEVQDFAALEQLLASRLTFGTAGLRARMGAGFARINSLTIIQTSQGLAEYLLNEGIASHGIVIGYDARHNSRKFAELAAAVFVAKKIPVYWYENLVHTPMVPFGVHHLSAAAGIMITASHNPAQDNGYKVYGSNGCQINTPVDEMIATSIIKNLEPITWDLTSQAMERKPVLEIMKAQYLDILKQEIGKLAAKTPKFVYTPLHGVGLPFMEAVVGTSGCMFIVEDQANPDPDFPTVRYPNPEEDGALTLAKTVADREKVHLIVANDPDADRFAAAEKVNNQWIQFTGDQIGVLLAYYLLEAGKLGSDGWALTTAVSSQMLSVIARDTFRIEETLTGFKWLGNKALELELQGDSVAFGYEEALGYMFPKVVHDKDGIAATLTFLQACTAWGSPWAKLQQLYHQYGYFETMNTYWKSSDPVVVTSVFARIRDLCAPMQVQVAGRKLVRWRDLSVGYDSGTYDHHAILPSSSNSQMVTCWLGAMYSVDSENEGDDGVRFTIRASGTEPKIKSKHHLQYPRACANVGICHIVYLECQAKHQADARSGAAQVLNFINQEWFSDPSTIIEEKYRDGIP